MENITFHFLQNSNSAFIKSFNTLKDCVSYIRITINDARNYTVEEMKDAKFVDDCSAFYLLENYKNLSKLPLSLEDC